jgi:hypothetical protein
MNSSTIMHDSTRDLAALAAQAALVASEPLEAPWFTEPPPSSSRSSRPPPVIHVGEFLGDPEVDAWLR